MPQPWYKRIFRLRQKINQPPSSFDIVQGNLTSTNSEEATMDAAKVEPAGTNRRGYLEIQIESWAQLRETFEDPLYRSWAFRGQRNTEWSLYSSLSRYLLAYKVRPEYWRKQEARILRIFRRKAHLYLERVPDEKDSFQWLALLQHHGAPTRLLDFTWSPYVAAFYALAEANEGTNAAIWGLFPPALSREAVRTIRATQRIKPKEIGPWILGNYEKYFLPNEKPIVLIGEPHYMNQRLIAHSGTFVIPGVLDIPVERIITEHVDPHALVKFILKTDQLRRDAIKELYRMNVTYATLFHNLDGLARSMELELELHWAYDPVTDERLPHFEDD